MSSPGVITVDTLIERWDGFLLDSYGVLVHSGGPMPGAAALLARIRAAKKPFWIVTNDASRLPETIAARYASFGLEVTTEQVLTSGLLLEDWFSARRLERPRCLVLGTRDSEEYLRRAGGVLCDKTPGITCDVLAVCDDAGFPYVETLDLALTTLFSQCDAGRPPALVLPNPDLIYPKGPGGYGFTAGAIAFLLEQALLRRYPELSLRFERLGKPEPGLFRRAQSLAGSGRLVMVGDQLETDIAGARAAGMDAVLLSTGVSRWQDAWSEKDGMTGPTHILPALSEKSS